MGVHGLWRLVNATGKEVPLETLEGKILAIGKKILILIIYYINIVYFIYYNNII